jgi:hypothetical protein
MLGAWGLQHGYAIHPGTINLCSATPLIFPYKFESLSEHSALAQPDWRRGQAGFDPRLYRAQVRTGDLLVNGWVYRWSDEDHRSNFVGSTAECPSDRFCEFVTEADLSDSLPFRDLVQLYLGSTHDWGLGRPSGVWV